MTVNKSAAEASYDTVGDVLNYSVVVTNTGNVTLNNLAITDTLVDVSAVTPTGDTNNNGKLDVGESWTYTYSYSIVQADIDSGSVVNTASVTSSDLTDAVTSSHTVNAVQTKSMTVNKSAAETSYDTVGDVLNYTVVVTNTGNVTLNNLAITDTLVDVSSVVPTGDTNSNGLLDVGESWTYSYSYTIVQSDIDSGSVANTASVTSSDLTDAVTSSHTVNAVQTKSMSVTKSSTETSYDTVGDVLNYTVVVTNTGNATLNNLAITDTLVDVSSVVPTGDTNSNGLLDVGESWTYSYSYTVSQADIDRGSVVNTASVTSSDLTDAVTSSHTVNAVQTKSMTVEKSSDETSYDAVGDVLNYSVVVTNIGNVTLRDLAITDTLVDVSAIDPTGDVNNNGLLDVGESWTYSYSYTVSQADIDRGSVVNTASVTSSDLTDAVTSSHTVNAVQTKSMTVNKSAAEASYDTVGDVLNYTVVVANTGNVTLNNLAITDTLVDVSSVVPTGDTNSNGLLDVGESWTYSYSYTVSQADIDRGSVLNTASVTSSDLTDAVTSSHTVNAVQTKSMTVNKSAVETSYDTVGDVLNYSVVVTNTGNVTLNNLAITDTLVDVSAIDPTGDTNNNGQLDVGESWTYSYSYTVSQADIDRGSVVNTASVTSSDLTDAVTSSHTVNAVQTKSMTVNKSAEETSYDTVGDVLNYSVVVTNTGNVTLNNLAITDTLVNVSSVVPTGDTNNNGKLDVGESWTYSYSYTIVQSDIDRGSVTNTASVTSSDLDEAVTSSHTVNAEQMVKEKVTVSFTTDGQGTLLGSTTFSVLEGTAFTDVVVPGVQVDAGYTFVGWSPALPSATSTIDADVTYTAQFKKNIKLVDDPTLEPEDGYVRLSFKAFEHGGLGGGDADQPGKTLSYDVLIGTTFGELPIPDTYADLGYSFVGWTPALPAADSAVTATATYSATFRQEVSAVPSVDPIRAGDVLISGQGMAGATIVVTLPDGKTVETTVKQDGHWTVSTEPLAPGSQISVTQIEPGKLPSVLVEVTATGHAADNTLVLKTILYDVDGKTIEQTSYFQVLVIGPHDPAGRIVTIQNHEDTILRNLLPGQYRIELLPGEGKGYAIRVGDPVTLGYGHSEDTITVIGRALKPDEPTPTVPPVPKTPVPKTGEAGTNLAHVFSLLAAAFVLACCRKRLQDKRAESE